MKINAAALNFVRESHSESLFLEGREGLSPPFHAIIVSDKGDHDDETIEVDDGLYITFATSDRLQPVSVDVLIVENRSQLHWIAWACVSSRQRMNRVLVLGEQNG